MNKSSSARSAMIAMALMSSFAAPFPVSIPKYRAEEIRTAADILRRKAKQEAKRQRRAERARQAGQLK